MNKERALLMTMIINFFSCLLLSCYITFFSSLGNDNYFDIIVISTFFVLTFVNGILLLIFTLKEK